MIYTRPLENTLKLMLFMCRISETMPRVLTDLCFEVVSAMPALYQSLCRTQPVKTASTH